MNRQQAKGIIETLLFISTRPLTLERLREVFDREINRAAIKTILDELIAEYQGRNLQLVEIGGRYQLCTRPEYSPWIKKFYQIEKSTKLSQAALETLAIIAYKQPITRVEIEEIRGVESGGVLRTLLEKKLVKVLGRKNVPGKPLMYGSTWEFLQYFGLKDLSELPSLKDKELQDPAGPAESVVQRLCGDINSPQDIEKLRIPD